MRSGPSCAFQLRFFELQSLCRMPGKEVAAIHAVTGGGSRAGLCMFARVVVNPPHPRRKIDWHIGCPSLCVKLLRIPRRSIQSATVQKVAQYFSDKEEAL